MDYGAGNSTKEEGRSDLQSKNELENSIILD
jgi:hypothetical protein